MPSWSSECRRVFLLGSEGIASWGERCIVRRLEGGEGRVQTGADRAVKGLNRRRAPVPRQCLDN